MDPLTLATTVVSSFLVPLLKQGAAKLGEALTGAAGDSTSTQLVETSQTLWQRVQGLFTAPDERKALDAFEKFPDELQQRLRDLLRRRLESDGPLRAELEELITKPLPDHSSSGAQIMQAQFAAIIDARNTVITGGVITGIQVHPPPAQPPCSGPARAGDPS